MADHLGRAYALYEQSRFDMAVNELRLGLSEDPDDPMAHSLLALCLSAQEKFEEATREAQEAVHHAPDAAGPHSALARVYYDRNRTTEALAAIEESIRLDPEDEDSFALLGAIYFDQRRWQPALEAAERGLEVESEHVGCTNLRAMALIKLGRRTEAGATIDSALARNPEDAVTHANQGWRLLEQGRREKAMEHFKEALRLEPNNEWARQGIVEALKARHFIYGVMLRYFLWMNKLNRKLQWVLIISLWLGYRLLFSLSERVPALAPFIWPLLIAYIAFVFLSWTSSPLFNLLLRLNRYGRLALSRDQRVSSNWVGLALLGALASVAAYAITGHSTALFGALAFGLMVIPISSTFNCQPGWPRRVMGAVALMLAAVGVCSLVLILAAPPEGLWWSLGMILITPFFWGVIVASFAGNYLATVRPER